MHEALNKYFNMQTSKNVIFQGPNSS